MTPEEIRVWRVRHGLTQARLASLLKVDATTVAGWERGRATPAPFLWRALAHLHQELPITHLYVGFESLPPPVIDVEPGRVALPPG